jgi:Beta-lactamase enzyme family
MSGNRALGSPSRRLVPVAVAMVVMLAVAAGAVLAIRLGSHAGVGGAANQALGAGPRGTAPNSADPVPSPVRQHRDPFGSAAAALASSRPGMILAGVYDVGSGQEWTLGHGGPQAEASVVKLDILETLLARSGGTDETLPAADAAAAKQMMEYSDNAAATTLWFEAGGPGEIGSYNAKVGLRSTSLSPCVDCSGFPWPGWGLSTTTPEDQLALLRQLISPRSPLTAGQRRYALGLMENVASAQRWGVSGGVPPGVTVALKNGWLPLDAAADDWQVNSVGWIRGDGRDYLMAVLTTGNATEQDGIDMINKLAGIVWRNMAQS